MTDDKNKNPKPKAAPGEAPQPRKPAPPRASKEAIRESDLFPPDDADEAEADEGGSAGDALFEEESVEDAGSLEAVLASTDTSERIILVVDEEGQRRNETVSIIGQILPNAVIEAANGPEEAIGMMEEGDFDTYVVNFLMPGYSSSPFVKAVANHPEHPLLIGFAADKMSDALDPKKGLKIIPLKRLFDLDAGSNAENLESGPGGEAPE